MAIHCFGARGLTSPRQKCDAKEPCAACVNVDKGSECAYEPRQRPRPAAAFQASASKLSRPQTGPPSDPSPLTWSNSSEHTSLLALRPLTPTLRLPWEISPRIRDSEIVLGPSSDVLITQKNRGTTKCVSRLTGSSFTILPSIHFRTVARPLRVSLSFIPPEYMQISCVSGNDLDLTLYVFLGSKGFTCRRD